MQKVRVELVSRGIFLLRVFLSFVAGIFLPTLIITLNKDNAIPFLFVGGGFALLVYYMSRDWSKAIVEFEIRKEGLALNWIQRFLLDSSVNQLFKWDEIRDFMFQPEQQFDLFRIRLKNTWRISFYLKRTTSDFLSFYKYLKTYAEQVKQHNEIRRGEVVTIKEAVNVYEAQPFLLLALAIGVIGLVLTAMVLNEKPNPGFSYFYLAILLSGAFFLVFQVYSHWKKRK